MKLNILSSFFGTASTLMVLFSAYFRETYYMKLFLVSKISTLEEKRKIFKTEFLHIIDEKYKLCLELYNYLENKLQESYWLIYDSKLEPIKEKLQSKNMLRNLYKRKEANFWILKEYH